jgi:hypothetical protein
MAINKYQGAVILEETALTARIEYEGQTFWILKSKLTVPEQRIPKRIGKPRKAKRVGYRDSNGKIVRTTKKHGVRQCGRLQKSSMQSRRANEK